MLSHRLRLSNKPLRFALADYITPLNALYAYLAMLAFYAVWLFGVVTFLGRWFLGVYGRPMALGLYLFVGVTLIYAIVHEKNHGRVRHSPWRLALAGFFILVIIGVIFGLERGSANATPYFTNYQQGVLVLLTVVTLVYYAIPNVREADRLVKVMVYFLGALAVAELIGVLSRFMPMFRLPVQTLDFQFIIPFAAIYFFLRYLTSEDKMLWNGAVFGIVFLGCIATFQKPIVVPLILVLGFMGLVLLIVFSINSRLHASRIIKRALLIMLVLVVALLALELIIPGSFLGDYRLIFYDRYLKANPETGLSEGRLDGGRLEYYAFAWRTIADSRWLGKGIGAAFPHPYLAGRYAFPHSIFLDFLLAFGIVGVVAFLVSICIIIIYLLRNLNWTEYRLMKTTLLGYLLFAFTFSAGSNFLQILAMVHFTAIVLGVVLKVATLDGRGLDQNGPWRLRLRAYRRAHDSPSV